MRQRILDWVRDHRVIIIATLGSVAALIVIGVFVWAVAFRGDGDGKDKLVSGEPGGAGATGYTTSIAGRVLNTAGDPVSGALVRVSGPFRSTEAATSYEDLTDEAGKFKIKLPIDGEYDIFASADGYEHSALVSGQGIEEIIGDFTVDDITLKRRQEVIPQRGSAGFVYGEGILDEEGVYRVLLLHGIISSRDEVVDIFEDSMTGQGWSTFVRDGQTISVRPIIYNNEPAWHVVLQQGREDGLTDVFVQKACGNISAPPGEKPPTRGEVMPPPPGPVPAPVPTPPPPVTPPPTPPGATPTPTPPTVTPTPTPTPTPPTRTPTPTPTPTPVPPVCDLTIIGPHRVDNTQTHARMQASLHWYVRPNFTPSIQWFLDGVFIGGGEAVQFMASLNVQHSLSVAVLHGTQVVCTDIATFAEGSIPPGDGGPGTDPLPTATPIPAPTPGSDPDDGYEGP
jgi:hypothetical protein